MSRATWWIVGGTAAFVVTLGILASRTARATTTPPGPLPTPVPTPPAPAPLPRQPVPTVTMPPLVRQGSLSSTTSPAVIRILQQQLQQLGYTITRIDGRPSTELQQATLAFENQHRLSHFTPNLELLLAVDSVYGEMFDPYNRRQY